MILIISWRGWMEGSLVRAQPLFKSKALFQSSALLFNFGFAPSKPTAQLVNFVTSTFGKLMEGHGAVGNTYYVLILSN